MLTAALALLPFAVAAVLALGLRRQGDAWDLSAGKALLAWAGLVSLYSECASLAWRLDLRTALAFWLLALGGALLWARAAEAPRAVPALPGAGLRYALWSGLAAILLFLALLGVQAPVSNYDSMLYHLPRVEQWAQNRSLIHFPTPYDLQVFYPPWAELAILQTRLLSGGVEWAPLVQVLALLGACAGAARLARVLGGGPWSAVLAALALAAMPMANLQATTSQNDLVCTLWLIWAAVFTVRYHQQGGRSDAFWAALSLGLGLASKGTFYILGLPWGLGLAWAWLRRQGPRQAWAPLLMALLILAPSAGHWHRNHHVSGTLMGSSQEHLVGRVHPAGLASNAIKNLSYDALSTDPRWNYTVHWAVAALHGKLGWELDPPQLIWGGLEYGHYFNLSGQWHEDYAGSPWHLLLAGFMLAAALLGWRRNSAVPWVLAAAWAGYAVYAGAIRFNPWCTRLHLPVFALLCGPLGLAMEDALGQRRPAMALAGATMLAYAAWISGHHLGQPWQLIFPARSAEAYAQSHAWRSGLQAGWSAAQSGPKIGLLNKERELELPLWVGLRQGGALRIQHLNSSSATAKALLEPPFAGFLPDVIVANEGTKAPPFLARGGRRWKRGLVNELWAVYTPLP